MDRVRQEGRQGGREGEGVRQGGREKEEKENRRKREGGSNYDIMTY